TWTANGQTYGDRLMGIRVLDRSGALLHPGRAIVRAVLCVLFPLLLFWAIVDARRRSVQDLIVRTSVVYDWRVRAGGA
ncbi:MAG TPA: RDD family protein, partial [Actinomycetota bacterium]|nr:RDD family protein [Actinomycetota bacterium]